MVAGHTLDPAAGVLADAVDNLGLSGRILLMGFEDARPADAVRVAGGTPVSWSRRYGGVGEISPWPPEGFFDAVLLRLPKAKEEFAMLLHAAADRLKAGAPLFVVGANDEGIKSAKSIIEPLFGEPETLATKRHCRLLRVLRPASIKDLRPRQEDWRTVAELELPFGSRPWVSWPGAFAHGRLDEGTALLLSVLPQIAPNARVLDYACGTGPIAAAVLNRYPAVQMDMLDVDALALDAASVNVPQAYPLLGDSLGASRKPYGLIISNPPIHSGVQEDHAVLKRLIHEAPAALTPTGMFLMVVQRRVPARPWMEAAFSRVELVATDSRFSIWQGARK